MQVEQNEKDAKARATSMKKQKTIKKLEGELQVMRSADKFGHI